MKKLLLIGLAVLALYGCEAVDVPEGEAESAASPAVVDQVGRRVELVADYEFGNLNKFEECVYDFDGDGNDENILLLTSKEKDTDGEFVGEDTNKWFLMVKTADGVYPLYDETTSYNLNLNMAEVYTEGDETEPVIRVTMSSTAAYEIREYRYSDGGFTEKTVYHSGAINELPVTRY